MSLWLKINWPGLFQRAWPDSRRSFERRGSSGPRSRRPGTSAPPPSCCSGRWQRQVREVKKNPSCCSSVEFVRSIDASAAALAFIHDTSKQVSFVWAIVNWLEPDLLEQDLLLVGQAHFLVVQVWHCQIRNDSARARSWVLTIKKWTLRGTSPRA